MKTLTLHQPWASLVAVGAKSIETRPWRAPANMIGQRLIVHAGAAREHHGKAFMLARIALSAGQIDKATEATFRDQSYPFGVVVASCVLADCVPIIGIGDPEPEDKRFVCALPHDTLIVGTEVGLASRRDDQLPFGDFSTDGKPRYGWIFEDVKPTSERCPACWGAHGVGWSRLRPDGPWHAAVQGTDGAWTTACTLTPLSAPVARVRGPGRTCAQAGCALAALNERRCPVCDGHGFCDPVPVKGKQGLWEWTPERVEVSP